MRYNRTVRRYDPHIRRKTDPLISPSVALILWAVLALICALTEGR